MATYYVAAKYPVLIETYERFKGPNPWDAGAAEVPWSVGGYRWRAQRKHVPKIELAPIPGARPKRMWAGIQSQKAGVLRLLPPGLQELWWTRQLPARDIPWILGELSPQPKIDTRPGTRINEILLGLFWMFHFSIVCVLAYGVLLKGDSMKSFIDEVGFYSYVTIAVGLGFPIIGVLLFLSGKKDARKLKERALALLSARASGTLPPTTTSNAAKTESGPHPAYEGHTI